MENVENLIEYVKDQIAFQGRMANKYAGDQYREGLHLKNASTLREILDLLERLASPGPGAVEGGLKSANTRSKILLSLDDIKDIPSELLDELNLTEADKQEMLIESIIRDAGGILSLDKILVEFFKKTRQVIKRNTVISRLYRMANRGLIYSLPSKKGLYSTYELSEQDVKRLFGKLDADGDETPLEDTPAPQPPPTPTRPNILRRSLELKSSTRQP